MEWLEGGLRIPFGPAADSKGKDSLFAIGPRNPSPGTPGGGIL